ncbi:MAG: hypothetical protein ABEK04_01780 [Candidatus Nanohalobium sp.]
MTGWDLTYEEVENVRPFMEVAEDRGYTIGENAEEMAVGEYRGENVFLDSQDPSEASYNLLADLVGDQLSDYGVRTPSSSYDGEAVLEEVGDEEDGILITEELGTGTPMSEGEHSEEFYAESLINTFAFEALMGQGDIPENTDTDSEGFYAFDFGNSGANIKGIYNAVKGEAQKVAENLGLDQEVQDYDRIGERAVEMAESLDLEELETLATEKGVKQQAYIDIRQNIETARKASETQQEISEYFKPESPDEDEGVELL